MSARTAAGVVYPDSDGKPMADNTLQFQWIQTIQGNLDALFADRDDVFVAGDNLIYPKQGDPSVCTAPDVYVAFGRPKGRRGSYKVWEEGNVFPQVVFEVLSPGNTRAEMKAKRGFYRRYGAREYYVYDPDENLLEGWLRDGNRLIEVEDMNGWASPLLGVRFDTSGDPLAIYRPDGARFHTFVELGRIAEQAERAAEDARRQAEDARRQAENARRENDRLREMLRTAGIDPGAPPG